MEWNQSGMGTRQSGMEIRQNGMEPEWNGNQTAWELNLGAYSLAHGLLESQLDVELSRAASKGELRGHVHGQRNHAGGKENVKQRRYPKDCSDLLLRSYLVGDQLERSVGWNEGENSFRLEISRRELINHLSYDGHVISHLPSLEADTRVKADVIQQPRVDEGKG